MDPNGGTLNKAGSSLHVVWVLCLDLDTPLWDHWGKGVKRVIATRIIPIGTFDGTLLPVRYQWILTEAHLIKQGLPFMLYGYCAQS